MATQKETEQYNALVIKLRNLEKALATAETDKEEKTVSDKLDKVLARLDKAYIKANEDEEDKRKKEDKKEDEECNECGATLYYNPKEGLYHCDNCGNYYEDEDDDEDEDEEEDEEEDEDEE